MNNIERFTTLKLEFSRVAWYLGNILSALLGREIHCTAKAEDDSYWSIAAIDDRFTNSEIVSLIQYVGGDATMIRRCIPPDSNSSRSLGMDLCEALLKHVLKMDWKQEFVTEDALWLLGNWPEPVQLPEADENLIFIDSRVIDCSKLMTMAEFVEKLFDDGGTFTALTNLCEDNEVDFGTPLYWMHPYTDGLYNGCYFALVREGVLALSYFGLKKNIFSFTNGWYSWLSTGILLVFLASLALSQQYLTLVFAVIFSAPIVVMGYLIARFRPDAGTNQIIQIVVSIALVMLALTFSVVIIFTDNTTAEDLEAVPLYYEDIGGEAGEIKKAEVDQSSSIFGSGMRCWIDYEEEYVYYYVYSSDHSWIINTIWDERMEHKYNQTGEDVTDLFGAVDAVRNVAGDYLVKFQDSVLILSFAEDTILTEENVDTICAALLGSR